MSGTPAVSAVLQPAGPVAAVITEMSWALIIGGAIVFCIVMVALLGALLGARHQRGDHRDKRRDEQGAADGRAGTRRWIIGAGFVFPVVVLSALLAYSTCRSRA